MRFGYSDLRALVADLALHVTMLQNLTDASSRLRNAPLWTLALEEQLYLLYFPLLWLRRSFGWRTTLAVVSGVCLAWRAAPLLLVDLPPLWTALGPARWLEWALGAVAVEAFVGRIALPKVAMSLSALVATAIAAVLTTLAAPEPLRGIASDPLFGIAFFVWLNTAVRSERDGLVPGRLVSLLARVGVISYSLYLVHVPLLSATRLLVVRAGLPESLGAILMVGTLETGVALSGAWLFYRLIESRAKRWSRTAAV